MLIIIFLRVRSAVRVRNYFVGVRCSAGLPAKSLTFSSENPYFRKFGYPDLHFCGFLEIRITGNPYFRIFRNLEIWISGNPDFQISGNPENPDFRISDISEYIRMYLDISGYPNTYEYPDCPDVRRVNLGIINLKFGVRLGPPEPKYLCRCSHFGETLQIILI